MSDGRDFVADVHHEAKLALIERIFPEAALAVLPADRLAIADATRFVALELANVLPWNPEFTLTIRKLQEAQWYANASLDAG